MKSKLTNNLGLKIISVLIACLIWLLVMDNNDPEDTQVFKNVPITIKNEDTITNANKTFTVQDDVDKVTVYVTARRSVRSRLNASDFVIRADLENYNEAIGAVPLEFSCTDYAVATEDMRIVPSSLKIKMEDKVEQSFAIVASVPGKAKKGYELGRTTLLSGDTVKIAGPQSLINIIGKVFVSVDITNVTGESVKQCPIQIEDKNGTSFTESQMGMLELKNAEGVLLAENSVDVRVEAWKVYGDIPIEVPLNGNVASGYRITDITMTPSTVNLVASEEAINILEGKLILKDQISIEGLTETQEFTLDINNTIADYVDMRVQNETASVVTVKLQVEEVGSKTYDFLVSNLSLKNAPEGKKLIFSPADKLQINVRSTEEKIQNVTAGNIKASVDLLECAENGSYNVPVLVELPEGCELGNEVSIVVNVEDAENETEEEAEVLTED